MTGLVTFHCQDYIWFGKEEVTNYDKDDIIDKLFQCNNIIKPYDKRKFLNCKEGIIKGKVYGTNIDCLLKLVGTPYMPELKDAILFLEEYRSDIVKWNTMLEQFNQMKALNKAVVFGYIYQLQYVEKNEYSIVDELKTINSDVPIIKTNDFGHQHGNSIIPIGVNIEINSTDGSIKIVDDYLK